MKWPLDHWLVVASMTPAAVPALFVLTEAVVALANLATGSDARPEVPWTYAAMFLAAVWLLWSPVMIGAMLYARKRPARAWLVYGPLPGVALVTFLLGLTPTLVPYLLPLWAFAACSMAAGLRLKRTPAMPPLPATPAR